MHHVRTPHFLITWCTFTTFLSSRGKFTALFVCHRTISMAAVYRLKTKHDQDKFGAVFLDAFDTISCPLEDKHVVKCTSRNTKMSWRHTETLSSMCISMYHVISKHWEESWKYTVRRAAEYFWVLTILMPWATKTTRFYQCCLVLYCWLVFVHCKKTDYWNDSHKAE